MPSPAPTTMSKRDLLTLIGRIGGGALLYPAMMGLGVAEESSYKGPPRLDGDPKGATVLILGAGLAGMLAAMELHKAGYRVRILEHNTRAGGRCWTLRGGDVYTELGGATQRCAFDRGLYFNPGPWRIPFHHHGLIDYCRRLGVALEPFVQLNSNAWLHSSRAFGGKPQRFRHVQADFHGHVAELLAKATRTEKLGETVTRDEAQHLLEALREWGALDADYVYRKGEDSSWRRGFEREPGGGPNGAPAWSEPLAWRELLASGLWGGLTPAAMYDDQPSMMQPVGGMDMIAKAFLREVQGLIRFGAKVTAIRQDATGVSIVYEDVAHPGKPHVETANWCICTIPLPILSHMELSVGAPLRNAIDGVPYSSAFKVGLQFKRRFWEQDDAIYGGITYTDLPIGVISYPSSNLGGAGKGVLLGAYAIGDANAFEFTGLAPQERIERALNDGAAIHPQYREAFETGISVAWHRNPYSQGCGASWRANTRKQHYADLCTFDGRILLAGEHVSHLRGWQEGAILSSLDAVARLHRRVVAP
jgi:monoamine oxidase